MTSPRLIDASMDRPQRSTGPRSPEVRQASRADGLEPRTTAWFGTPEEELEAIRERQEEWRAKFAPGDAVEEWILGRLAAESYALERYEREEVVLRSHFAGRSVTMWDDDRRLAVLDLAARLARNPERIAVRLRATAQGCNWLIAGWGDLAFALERTGGWDERRRARAMDLLGIPEEARARDPLGLETATVEQLGAIVTAQIQALEALKADSLDAIDAVEHQLATEGKFVDVPKALKLVRRQKAECDRRINWFWSQLRSDRPQPAPSPDAPHAGRPAPEPTPPPPPPPPNREEVARRAPAETTPAGGVHRESGMDGADALSRILSEGSVPMLADLAPRPDRRSRPDPKALKRRRRR